MVFLATLVVLDSYKLLGFRRVVTLVAVGAASGAAALVLNPWLLERLDLEVAVYNRFIGPGVEELLKGSLVAYALMKGRVGFLVDAAIWGFAIGTGFAAFENSLYFIVLGKPVPMLWLVRGFGTAIMHGGATALVAVTGKYLSDRYDSIGPHVVAPGLLLAGLVHAAFNSFYLSPVLSTLLLLVVLPLVFVLVFRASEEATRDWLGTGFDSDQELLELIHGGQVVESPIGEYLHELKDRFPAAMVVDMLCWIRLHLELSIRAKGVLLMRKAGFTAPLDPEVDARLEELRHLERTIGPTGMLALHPIVRMSHRDLWQMHHLEGG